jgi:hypothetical protein
MGGMDDPRVHDGIPLVEWHEDPTEARRLIALGFPPRLLWRPGAIEAAREEARRDRK